MHASGKFSKFMRRSLITPAVPSVRARRVDKVAVAPNVSDILTNAIGSEPLGRHLVTMGLEAVPRHDLHKYVCVLAMRPRREWIPISINRHRRLLKEVLLRF